MIDRNPKSTEYQYQSRRAICHSAWLTLEVVGVDLGEVGPLLGEVVEREDGGDRAHRDAGAAIDAFDGVDVDHFDRGEIGFVLFWVDAIHRTGVDAGRVFRSDTGFRNYVCHSSRKHLNYHTRNARARGTDTVGVNAHSRY